MEIGKDILNKIKEEEEKKNETKNNLTAS